MFCISRASVSTVCFQVLLPCPSNSALRLLPPSPIPTTKLSPSPASNLATLLPQLIAAAAALPPGAMHTARTGNVLPVPPRSYLKLLSANETPTPSTPACTDLPRDRSQRDASGCVPGDHRHRDADPVVRLHRCWGEGEGDRRRETREGRPEEEHRRRETGDSRDKQIL